MSVCVETAGTIAAGVQSGIGNVVAGSAFATLQSAAAGGYGVAAVNGVIQGTTVVAVAASRLRRKKRDQGGEADRGNNEEEEEDDGIENDKDSGEGEAHDDGTKAKL
jgi:hypothetical protein